VIESSTRSFCFVFISESSFDLVTSLAIDFILLSVSILLMAASSDATIPTITVDGQQSQSEGEPNTNEITTTATAGRRRQKVPLAPGHTLAHWNALVQTRKRSVPAVKITPKVLALHHTQDDAWVSLNGKVYDVTKYLDYHPGGSYTILSSNILILMH
jgi:mannose-6-phosphate isomerase-like protein (cupin superfamily)